MTKKSDSSVDNLIDKLMDEFVARQQAGQSPTISEYCQRHPEHADEIRQLFTTLSALEGVKPVAESDCPIGETIGEYQILGEIGRGGMGVVYEAQHRALGRRVALKVLQGRLARDHRALARFHREARAIAKLHHTNIVPLFEVGNDDQQSFLAMQLITGRSLDRILEDQAGDLSQSSTGRGSESQSVESSSSSSPFNKGKSEHSVYPDESSSGSSHRRYFDWVARVGQQAAEALAYAHKRGVIHRDVKPSNILEDESGVIWLRDFGLAKTDDEELTQTGDFVGTLRYMSPERFRGLGDERADIYSLGLTLYELLTRQSAFPASDRLNLIQLIEQKDPQRPRLVNPRIPRDLETIVLRSISKEPNARYVTAQAFADDLDRFLNDRPIKARRQSAFERLRRWSRRNRGLAAALAAIASLLVLIAIGTTVMSIHSANLTQIAEQRSEELQQNLYFAVMNLAGHAASGKYGSETVRTRLERWDPKLVGNEYRGWEWYYLHALTHRERLTSPPLEGWVWSVDFNPLGTEYVHCVNGWGIQVRSSESGEVVRDKFLGSARYVQWSPDGEQIAVSGFGANVNVCDAKTLDVVCKIGGDLPREVWCVKWSPDGKRLATCRRPFEDEKNLVRIWNAANGELLQTLEGHKRSIQEISWSPDGTKLATAAYEKNIRIWHAESGAELASIPQLANTLCWSPDSDALAVGHHAISIIDVATGDAIAVSDSDANLDVQRIRWRPGEKQLACSHGDGTLTLWDIEPGRKLRTFYGHTGSVRDLAWHPDGTCIASCGMDNTVRVWDVDTNDQTQVFPVTVYNIDWNSAGTQLAASSSWETRVSILQPGTGSMKVFDSTSLQPNEVRFSPDDRKIAYAGREYVKILDVHSEQITILNQTHWFQSVAWNNDGSRLAAAAWLKPDLMIWNTQSGDRILHVEEDHPTSVDWNQDGTRLATGGADGSVKMRDAEGNLIWRSIRDSGISKVRWSPDGLQLASAENGAIVIWDAATGKEVAILDAVREEFVSVDWSPDANRLVSASPSSVSIWAPATGHVAMKLPVDGANCVRWSRDGSRVAAACGSAGVYIWDASRGYGRQ